MFKMCHDCIGKQPKQDRAAPSTVSSNWSIQISEVV